MQDDVENVKRYVSGFSKLYDSDGNSNMEVRYELKPLKLSFLQRLFKIDKNSKDPVTLYLIDCYNINAQQANELQPYVIGGSIDLNKYDWLLDTYDASTCEHSEEYLKAKAESENENL